jgi:hypothetical protein
MIFAFVMMAALWKRLGKTQAVLLIAVIFALVSLGVSQAPRLGFPGVASTVASWGVGIEPVGWATEDVPRPDYFAEDDLSDLDDGGMFGGPRVPILARITCRNEDRPLMYMPEWPESFPCGALTMRWASRWLKPAVTVTFGTAADGGRTCVPDWNGPARAGHFRLDGSPVCAFRVLGDDYLFVSYDGRYVHTGPNMVSRDEASHWRVLSLGVRLLPEHAYPAFSLLAFGVVFGWKSSRSAMVRSLALGMAWGGSVWLWLFAGEAWRLWA